MNKPLVNRGLLLVPLIGATDSLPGALGLWLAWSLTTLAHGGAMGLVRSRLSAPQQLIASVVLAATLTACADLAAQAWALEHYGPQSLYVAWIAMSCVVLEQERFFGKSRWPGRLRLAGLFGLWMIAVGGVRALFGSVIPLAQLAPGGFILLGLLLAAYQAWTTAKPHSSLEEPPRP